MSLLTIPITLIFSSARQSRNKIRLIVFLSSGLNKATHLLVIPTEPFRKEIVYKIPDLIFSCFLRMCRNWRLASSISGEGVSSARAQIFMVELHGSDTDWTLGVFCTTQIWKSPKKCKIRGQDLFFRVECVIDKLHETALISLEAGKRSNYHQIPHFLCSSGNRYRFHKPWHLIPNINYMNPTHIPKV